MAQQDLQEVLSLHVSHSAECPARTHAALVLDRTNAAEIAPVEGGGGIGHGVGLGMPPVVAAACLSDCFLHARAARPYAVTVHTPSEENLLLELRGGQVGEMRQRGSPCGGRVLVDGRHARCRGDEVFQSPPLVRARRVPLPVLKFPGFKAAWR